MRYFYSCHYWNLNDWEFIRLLINKSVCRSSTWGLAYDSQICTTTEFPFIVKETLKIIYHQENLSKSRRHPEKNVSYMKPFIFASRSLSSHWSKLPGRGTWSHGYFSQAVKSWATFQLQSKKVIIICKQ